MMTVTTKFNTGAENLDTESRVVRAVIGVGLIGFVMTTPQAPLGWYTILPLLAVLPIFTAITGWDPIRALFRHNGFSRRALNLSPVLRGVIGAVGVAMVGSVYVAAGLDINLGLWSILPILGIYPVFAAIAGMDPITALYNLDREWTAEAVTKPQPTVFGVVHGSRTEKQQDQAKPHSKAA